MLCQCGHTALMVTVMMRNKYRGKAQTMTLKVS
jgi:hypothetical protein